MSDFAALKAFPTIRAQVGDWFYYVTTLPFYEAEHRIVPASELVYPTSLDRWIQREIMPKRRRQIADYLLYQREHFFSAIVVGVYAGEPNWYEIEVAENNLFESPGLDPRFRSALGILELSGDEKLYAIDGQHRVAGIKEALARLRRLDSTEEYEQLANEDLTMIFVAADMSPEHLQRMRRMFSTLNKRAVSVSKAELIALDEDEPAPITTRRLVSDYPPFSAVSLGGKSSQEFRFVHLGKTNQISQSNQHSFTTIVTLLDLTESIFSREIKALTRSNHMNRPPQADLDELYENNVEIWEILRDYVPEIDRVFNSQPIDMLAGQYRNDNGGHMLFRPIGQQAFAGALGMLRTRNRDVTWAIEHLVQAPMELSDLPWRHVLWDPSTKRMVNANRTVAENLFLHMVGEPPKSDPAKFQKRFKELYEEEGMTVNDVPVTPR